MARGIDASHIDLKGGAFSIGVKDSKEKNENWYLSPPASVNEQLGAS